MRQRIVGPVERSSFRGAISCLLRAAASAARPLRRRIGAAPPPLRPLPACMRRPGPSTLPFNGARNLVPPSGPASAVPDPPAEAPANAPLFLGAGMGSACEMPASPQLKDRMLRKCALRPAWRRLLEVSDMRDTGYVRAALGGLGRAAAARGRGCWIRRLEGAGTGPRRLSGLRGAPESGPYRACRRAPAATPRPTASRAPPSLARRGRPGRSGPRRGA